MAYNYNKLALRATQILNDEPGTSLKFIAGELGVDRHTIARALRQVLSCTYRDLQAKAYVKRIAHLRSLPECASLSGHAQMLGYTSARSASRRARCLLGRSLKDLLITSGDDQ